MNVPNGFLASQTTPTSPFTFSAALRDKFRAGSRLLDAYARDPSLCLTTLEIEDYLLRSVTVIQSPFRVWIVAPVFVPTLSGVSVLPANSKS